MPGPGAIVPWRSVMTYLLLPVQRLAVAIDGGHRVDRVFGQVRPEPDQGDDGPVSVIDAVSTHIPADRPAIDSRHAAQAFSFRRQRCPGRLDAVGKALGDFAEPDPSGGKSFPGSTPRRASLSIIGLSPAAGGLLFIRAASRPKKATASSFSTCSTGAVLASTVGSTGTSAGGVNSLPQADRRDQPVLFFDRPHGRVVGLAVGLRAADDPNHVGRRFDFF